jgi:dTDP-4-amino-4,6-dideoxygalactose transaminase
LNSERELQEIGADIEQAVDRVLGSGWFVRGEEVAGFESEFAAYIGAKSAVGTNSGSDALFLAVQCLGIGPGDEIITSALTVPMTADAITRNGATPVFADIDPETYCLDAAAVEEKVTKSTRAILPVHVYGHPADMDALMAVAASHDLAVIEDSSHAHGAEWRGCKAGSLGRIGCFSLYPTKNLGAYGDAGVMVTDDEELAETVRVAGNCGMKRNGIQDLPGINSRLDEMQAAILRAKLPHLDPWNERRRNIATIYDDALDGTKFVKPVERAGAKHVYHQYVIRSGNRDDLVGALRDKGVQCMIHYPVPVHMQKTYSRSDGARLPVTEEACRTVLSLPIDQWMTGDEARAVAEAVNECGV